MCGSTSQRNTLIHTQTQIGSDTEKHTYTHSHSFMVVISFVNGSSYSIFQGGPASRLQSITKYITEHFPLEAKGR